MSETATGQTGTVSCQTLRESEGTCWCVCLVWQPTAWLHLALDATVGSETVGRVLTADHQKRMFGIEEMISIGIFPRLQLHVAKKTCPSTVVHVMSLSKSLTPLHKCKYQKALFLMAWQINSWANPDVALHCPPAKHVLCIQYN